MQFVLPEPFCKLVLIPCQNDVGNSAQKCTKDLLRDRVYCQYMARDAKNHITQCSRYLHFKARPQVVELKPIIATYPLELVHIDFWTTELGKTSKDINVLIITDHFMCYVQAFLTPTKKAGVVAPILWDKYFVHYGLPEQILSDQGWNFENELIQELFHMLWVKKLRTMPYRPWTNGQCEEFNSILIAMLGTLPPEAKRIGKCVSTLVHGYNCTRSQATGLSPNLLLFQRKPHLPINTEFGVETPDITMGSQHKYAQRLKWRTQWAYQKAKEVN